MAATVTPEAPAPVVSQIAAQAASESTQYNTTGEMIKARMPFMVKGAGYVGNGNQPLPDGMDVMTKAVQATTDLRMATYRGYRARSEVSKGLNTDFLNQFGYLKTALSQQSLGEQLQQVISQIPGGADALSKSFTAGSLGIGTVSGLVPFDLRAPSRLIYPVNK